MSRIMRRDKRNWHPEEEITIKEEAPKLKPEAKNSNTKSMRRMSLAATAQQSSAREEEDRSVASRHERP
jgi:hypothetical protein